MKIRTGFVSNSSSSSFVFAFKEPVKTLGQLIDLFGRDNASFSIDLFDSMDGPIGVDALASRLECRASEANTLDSFVKAHKGYFFYIAEFGDNHGSIVGDRGALLEREGLEIFSNVPVISFNNH